VESVISSDICIWTIHETIESLDGGSLEMIMLSSASD